MKQRVTLALGTESVSYLDEIAAREKKSRSAIVQFILTEFVNRQRQIDLARQAAAFFAQPESAEEAGERSAWERLGMEVLGRET